MSSVEDRCYQRCTGHARHRQAASSLDALRNDCLQLRKRPGALLRDRLPLVELSGHAEPKDL